MAIDLNNLVPGLFDLGFELAGQIQVPSTYTARTAAVYDPATGATTETNQTASCRPIYQAYKGREIDNERVLVGDRKAIIKMSELTGITTKSKQDTLTFGGEDWHIVDFEIEPTGNVMKAQIRKVKGGSA